MTQIHHFHGNCKDRLVPANQTQQHVIEEFFKFLTITTQTDTHRDTERHRVDDEHHFINRKQNNYKIITYWYNGQCKYRCVCSVSRCIMCIHVYVCKYVILYSITQCVCSTMISDLSIFTYWATAGQCLCLCVSSLLFTLELLWKNPRTANSHYTISCALNELLPPEGCYVKRPDTHTQMNKNGHKKLHNSMHQSLNSFLIRTTSYWGSGYELAQVQ